MIKYLKNIKNVTITLLGDDPSLAKKQIQINFLKLLILVSLYSCIVFILGFILLNITPLHKIFYSDSIISNLENKQQLTELNQKIVFLSKEIEKLKSTNDRLRYAIMLGDSGLLKEINDSAKVQKQNPLKKAEGNLFFILKRLIENIQETVEDNFFIRPLNGFISRGFDPEEGHYGIDFSVKTGAPIFAVANGYVVFSDFTVDDGYMTIIVHPNDYISIYKHCSSNLKKERDKVIQGELIALSGNTGENSFGPHLHFELWKNGSPIDPLKLFIN